MMESDTAEDFSLAREMLATVGLAGFEERNFPRCPAVSSSV